MSGMPLYMSCRCTVTLPVNISQHLSTQMSNHQCLFPGVHHRFVQTRLNFKQLKSRCFFFKGGSSLVGFIKQKTFNIIQYAGFVAQQQRCASFMFLCYPVQTKAKWFFPILFFLFQLFSSDYPQVMKDIFHLVLTLQGILTKVFQHF